MIDQLMNPLKWPKGVCAGITFCCFLLVASIGLAFMASDSAKSFVWLIVSATIYVGHCISAGGELGAAGQRGPGVAAALQRQ